MIEQQNKKRNFDQFTNYNPTYDDPSNPLFNDNVTHHGNIHSTIQSTSTYITSTPNPTNNIINEEHITNLNIANH
jgi:hypothetical protein